MKGLEKFVNSPHFLRGMAGLSIICLGIAVRKEEKLLRTNWILLLIPQRLHF